jgi:hypothetical protein
MHISKTFVLIELFLILATIFLCFL